MYKLNFDGALDAKKNRVKVGVVIKNNKGEVMAIMVNIFEGIFYGNVGF